MNRNIDEVLKEIFAKVPIPSNLRTPKKRFYEGKMKLSAKQTIVEKYSNYKVVVHCELKETEA